MRKISSLKNTYYKLKYHRRLANKLWLNNNDKLLIKSEFKNWLLGIEEDDQLPLEISCICFCFKFNQKQVNLSVSGHEFVPNLIETGSYNPLEATYFNCELLNAFVNNKNNLNYKGILQEKYKQQVYLMFEQFLKSFQNDINFLYLNNKKIVMGEFLRERKKFFKFTIA